MSASSSSSSSLTSPSFLSSSPSRSTTATSSSSTMSSSSLPSLTVTTSISSAASSSSSSSSSLTATTPSFSTVTPFTSTSPLPTTSSSSSSLPPPSTSSLPPIPPSSPTPPPTSALQIPTVIFPLTTFSSTIFITTTDTAGVITTIAPATITSYRITTQSDGITTTVTQVGVNPTLSPDDRPPASQTSFFQKTSAVAGVFVLVGLASAVILLWVVFAIRRRRLKQQLEYDTATTAALAAVGFYRAPLDDEDGAAGVNSPALNSSSMNMTQRSSSGYAVPPPIALRNSGTSTSQYYDDPGGPSFNPYTEFLGPSTAAQGGYVAARTSSPTPQLPPAVARGHSQHDSDGSVADARHYGHTASYSAGSTEPLLAGHERSQSISGAPPSYFASLYASGPPPPPPRNPMRLKERQSLEVPAPESGVGNPSTMPMGSNNENGEAQLDSGLLPQQNGDSQNSLSSASKVENDDSRPILTVRNVADDHALSTSTIVGQAM